MNESVDGGSLGPHYTVPGILHFLQHEFTSYELDRIRWEDERTALKAQISFLQGEREGHQNMTRCLIKRIKMLELALRQERLDKNDIKVNGEVDESLFEDTSDTDDFFDTPKPPVNEQVKKGRMLLKQYLSEVGSTDRLLNARTNRLHIMQSLANSDTSFHKPLHVDQSTSPAPDRFKSERPNTNQATSDNLMMYIQSANKGNVVNIIDDQEDSSDEEKEGDYDTQTEDALGAFDFISNEDDDDDDEDDDEDDDDDQEMDDEPNSIDSFNQINHNKDNSMSRTSGATGMKSITSWNNYDSLEMYSRNGKRFNRKGPNVRLNYDEEETPIPNQLPKGTDNIPSGMKVSIKSNNDFKDIDFLQTNDDKKRVDNAEDGLFNFQTSLGELAGIQVSNDIEPSYDNYSLNTSKFWWQLKCSMKAHLDSIRQVCFHPEKALLFTGSEDCTLRMWDVDKMNNVKKGGGNDVEPSYTFRGHTAPVLSCTCTVVEDSMVLFSGSADATVRYWRLPSSAEVFIFDPYDDTVEEGVLRGHEEAVWGLTSHPSSVQTASCGADGMTFVWDITLDPPVVANFASIDGSSSTCIDYVRYNPDMIAVGYSSSVIVVFNVTNKTIVNKLNCEDEASCDSVNSLVTHPTTAMLIAGYTDKEIRMFDISTGSLTHHMTTHIEPVTSVAIDPSGFYLATVGHDCSLRIWNIEDKTCTQEMTAHQKRYDEAILSVKFHPTQPFIATAGADSTIKLYQ